MLHEDEASAPPEFLRLTGHPLRWRLLGALARSDRTVRELCRAGGGAPEPRVVPPGQLRRAELVAGRRSSADGRDTYYRVDLATCGEQLAADRRRRCTPRCGLVRAGAAAAAGAAAGPGAVPVHGQQRPVADGRGAAQRAVGGRGRGAQRGQPPKPLHPHAVRVMRELGIDIGRPARPSTSTSSPSQRFDYVISLCDRVREVCPELPGHPRGRPLEHARPRAAAAEGRATQPSHGPRPSWTPASGSCSPPSTAHHA